MMTHLQLKTGALSWKSRECPMNPAQLADAQIWKMIPMHNQQSARKTQTHREVPNEGRSTYQPKTKPHRGSTSRQPRTAQTRQATWEILRMAERRRGRTWSWTRPECARRYKAASALSRHIYLTNAKKLPRDPRKPKPRPYCREEEESIRKLLEHLALQSARDRAKNVNK